MRSGSSCPLGEVLEHSEKVGPGGGGSIYIYIYISSTSTGLPDFGDQPERLQKLGLKNSCGCV